mmetsp:Transcript_80459/g.159353  ORF Transcript_80459/g.159353 Transcript_80459/m.159353 type:complete len:92 (-) Transcript_80459:25-300(-)
MQVEHDAQVKYRQLFSPKTAAAWDFDSYGDVTGEWTLKNRKNKKVGQYNCIGEGRLKKEAAGLGCSGAAGSNFPIGPLLLSFRCAGAAPPP